MSKPDKTIMQIESQYVNQYNAQVARQERRRQRLMRRLIFFGVVVVVVFGALTIYHINQRSLLAEKQEQFDELSKQMAKLELEETGLREEISLLSDEEYILDIARTNYFLSNEGDLIFQVQELEERSY